jgi:hypothetical protein
MNIVESTKSFEAWLRRQTHVVEADLRLKHQRMAESLFMFFRATFYRWIQLWPKVCGDLVQAPRVLAVGDLHIENFGTWRDIEGRLIWGVNDFDETCSLSFMNDLVRLAVSTKLAIEEDHLSLRSKSACEAILSGYEDALETGGRPFVLSEKHQWLRQIAESELRDPVVFWEKMDALPAVKGPIPASARSALNEVLPDAGLSCRFVRRVAGLGSLGHQRLVALASWRGGRIAREAKALVPSSYLWAMGREGSSKSHYETIISQAVRCPDPFVRVRGEWIVRRLSPHCSRIELDTLTAERDELKLLRAMGWETANIHLGSKPSVPHLRRHLEKQKSSWLRSAVEDMTETVDKDWRNWKKFAA